MILITSKINNLLINNFSKVSLTISKLVFINYY